MAIYRGVGGVNREIKAQYRGVGGVNREIKEQYRGVGGVNRIVFTSHTKLFAFQRKRGDVEFRSTGIYMYANGTSSETDYAEIISDTTIDFNAGDVITLYLASFSPSYEAQYDAHISGGGASVTFSKLSSTLTVTASATNSTTLGVWLRSWGSRPHLLISKILKNNTVIWLPEDNIQEG